MVSQVEKRTSHAHGITIRERKQPDKFVSLTQVRRNNNEQTSAILSLSSKVISNRNPGNKDN